MIQTLKQSFFQFNEALFLSESSGIFFLNVREVIVDIFAYAESYEPIVVFLIE
jgi:hypothetical protein